MEGLDLTAIGIGSGGVGLAGFALVQLLRVLPGAIRRISDALSTAWEKRSAATLARAEAKRIAAQTEQTEAETEAASTKALAATLDDLRRRLDQCEARHEKAQRESAAAQVAAQDALTIATAMQRYVEKLARVIVDLGGEVPPMPSITPRAMPAVLAGKNERT